ncbi:MAG TPA: hypothetical protein VNO30_46015 [Kofleriaceae bacterium]|nr:hypothetical protein [Kofleriaceae bacterium]
MSMFVSVVRVTPAAFEAIKRAPSQLDGVFFDANEALMQRLGIAERDTAGFDYISAAEMLDAMEELEEAEASKDEEADEADEAEDREDEKDEEEEEEEDADEEGEEDEEEEEDAVYKDLGADGTLDYDAGFGPAFTLSPAAVQQAAQGSSVLELDEEVKALFLAAAQRGDYIIGVVS